MIRVAGLVCLLLSYRQAHPKPLGQIADLTAGQKPRRVAGHLRSRRPVGDRSTSDHQAQVPFRELEGPLTGGVGGGLA